MKTQTISGAFLLLLLAAAHALSHDYWLEPENFFLPASGGNVPVRLLVGEGLKSDEERPLQKQRTGKFVLLSAKGSLDLLASNEDGQTPVVSVSLNADGNHLLAMERKWTSIKIEPDKFKQYLHEEGLESIIAMRERAGESDTEGRERYSRYLKTLLQVGNRSDDTFKRIVGHRLEIIPQTNPYRAKHGDMLGVRISFDGKPLAGVKVFAENRDGGVTLKQDALTSHDGIARFKLNRRGMWSIRLVHMQRCTASDCDGMDWESFWAAYTFGMR